ncbi:cholesin-like [Tubulanus polymorphus]|uniref:cholesin-like n=1 Tax=Tubulanus polymorphus TaxID=672921 RepID=UPI003DA63856
MVHSNVKTPAKKLKQNETECPDSSKKKKIKTKKVKKIEEPTEVVTEIESVDTEQESPKKLEKKKSKKRSHEETKDPEQNDTEPGSTETPAKKSKKAKRKEKATQAEFSLDYLKLWKSDRKNWHFKKTRQVWLLRNLYDSDKISDKHFQSLLEYMVDMKGKARESTIEQAEKMIETDPPSDSEAEGSDKLKEKSDRAKQILQMLS